jgi:hypothetical protein
LEGIDWLDIMVEIISDDLRLMGCTLKREDGRLLITHPKSKKIGAVRYAPSYVLYDGEEISIDDPSFPEKLRMEIRIHIEKWLGSGCLTLLSDI